MKPNRESESKNEFAALENTQAISALMRNAETIYDTGEPLADLFNQWGLQLIVLELVKNNNPNLNTIIHREITNDVRQEIASMQQQFECPIIRMALELQHPFDAMAVTYPEIGESSNRRYIANLRKLGHGEIIVIPLNLHGHTCIMAVGMDDHCFNGTCRETVLSMASQFAVAACVRFGSKDFETAPQSDVVTRLFQPPDLSEQELLYLRALGRGYGNAVLAETLGLSEHGIEAFRRHLRKKFNAASDSQTIALAKDAGII